MHGKLKDWHEFVPMMQFNTENPKTPQLNPILFALFQTTNGPLLNNVDVEDNESPPTDTLYLQKSIRRRGFIVLTEKVRVNDKPSLSYHLSKGSYIKESRTRPVHQIEKNPLERPISEWILYHRVSFSQ